MQETKYAVEIRTWRKFPFHSFPEFVQVSPQLYVAKNVTLQEAKHLKMSAFLHCMDACYYDMKWSRSGGYRKIWMNAHNQEEYQCVYCGRWIPAKSITVDHVVPVYRAKHSRLIQFILTKKGYESINDMRNLVPACWQCNNKKGKSTAYYWTIRASLGKHQTFWTVYNYVKVLLLIMLAGAILKFFILKQL